MKKFVVLAATVMVLTACQSEDQTAQDVEPVVRGLRTVLVEDQETTTIRRFPSVLQPAEVTTLSFEVGGKLGAVDLKVGQVVQKNQVLATIDPKSLEIQVESSQAAVEHRILVRMTPQFENTRSMDPDDEGTDLHCELYEVFGCFEHANTFPPYHRLYLTSTLFEVC